MVRIAEIQEDNANAAERLELDDLDLILDDYDLDDIDMDGFDLNNYEIHSDELKLAAPRKPERTPTSALHPTAYPPSSSPSN